MSTTVDEIKAKLSIVEVMQERLKLRRTSGASYMGACPFHTDKTPSLSVSADKGVWHCFSCQRGGDLFTFVMEMEGLEFRDVLELLAKRAGVELKYERPEERSLRSRLLGIHDQAVRYYTAALQKSAGGQKALEYLKRRGVSNETLEQFKIGYAPFSWEGLAKALHKRDFSESDLVAAGLAIRSQVPGRGSRVYDRFRARIMFGISNAHGDVIGFSGRIFEPGLPPKEKARAMEAGKYINSPNTAIYEKKRVLYGFDLAKPHIRAAGNVIILEGNMDVALSHQAGVRHAVATCGTALGEEHLQQLKNLTDELVFCFDADAAGSNATRRALGLALAQNFGVAAILLPPDTDPADIVTQNPADWVARAAAKQDIMEFFLIQAKQLFKTNDPQGKSKFSEYVFEPLVWVQNQITRDHWLQRIARELGAGLNSVNAEFERFSKQRLKDSAYTGAAREAAAQRARSFQLESEENILALLLARPELIKPYMSQITADHFTDSGRARLWQAAQGIIKSGDFKKIDWLQKLPDEAKLVNILLLRAQHFFADDKAAVQELATGVAFVHNELHKRRRRTLEVSLVSAQAMGDAAGQGRLTQEYNELLRTLLPLKTHEDPSKAARPEYTGQAPSLKKGHGSSGAPEKAGTPTQAKVPGPKPVIQKGPENA